MNLFDPNKSTIRHNEVMEGQFRSLTTLDGSEYPGPWNAVVLSAHTGPVWAYVDDQGNVVPFSSVLVAWS